MSVYKVISNYYNDLLNFLSTESNNNRGLGNMFANITNDKKKLIVTKLADMMVRFDTAFNSELNFWAAKKKEQTWFFVIYLVMLGVILAIILLLYYFRVKEIKAEGGKTMAMIKSLMSYIIVYQVIFTIFMVMIMNIKSTQKLADGQRDILSEDLKIYSNYVFAGAHRDNLSKFFTFLGYWRRNSKQRYKDIYNNYLRNDSSFDVALSLFNINNNDNNQTAPTDVGKEVEVYDKLKSDIESSLITFYNDGNGYLSVKKLLLQASPILMLKEAKNIMEYYYFLAYRKAEGNPDQMNTEGKKKDIITNVVINPISNLLQEFDANAEHVDKTQMSAAIIQSEQDDKFKQSMDKLLRAFDYLVVFAYPVYLRVSDKDPQFPLPELLPSMPQNIIINDTDSDDNKKFLQGIKTVFGKVYSSQYQNIVTSAQNLETVTPAIKELNASFVPLFKELYYRVFMYMKGSIWFPFNKDYIVRKITQHLQASTSTAMLPAEYREDMVSTIYDSLITEISNNFDILAVRRSTLIDTISATLVPFKINVSTYQNFIINSLIQKSEKMKQHVDEIIEILADVSKTVTLKIQLYAENEVLDTRKFLGDEEFLQLINNVTFKDLQQGLQVDYYTEIVDNFYRLVSESVNLNFANLRNIYYQRQATIKTWKVAIIMVIVTLCLILVRTLMATADEWARIKKTQVTRDCDRLFAERELQARKTNFWIKMILPIFVVTFLISMLLAFSKKMEYAFDFNKEIIENNTNELRNTLDSFSKQLVSLGSNLDEAEKTQKLNIIDKVTDANKKEIFDSLKHIIDKYEKCNFIIESAKTQVPFPYPEVIMNGFMIVVATAALIYVLSTFAPVKRLRDVKKLNKLRERVMVAENIQEINEELVSHSTCHNEDMDSIILALKLVFFTFIIMFLIFYSVKIISTANDFKFGLYNSAYFEESKCYEG